MTQETTGWNRFLDILKERISPSELTELIFRVLGPGANDELPGKTHSDRCMAFLKAVQQRRKESDLLVNLHGMRPDINSEELFQVFIGLKAADQERVGKSLTNSPEGCKLLKQFPQLPGDLEIRANIYEYHWPPLWRSIRPHDKQLQDKLKEWGLSDNPFYPLRAEDESNLPDIFAPPVKWKSITSPMAHWLWGPSGRGHTALALMFQHQYRSEPPGTPERGFVVHCRDLVPSSGNHQSAVENAKRALEILEAQAAGYTSLTIPAHLQIELENKRKEVARLEDEHSLYPNYSSEILAQILKEVVYTLVDFLALNPHGLLNCSKAAQQSMAALIRTALPDPEILRSELLRCKLEEEGSGAQLKQCLEKAHPLANFSPETAGDWLPHARPDGFGCLYLLLETKGAWPADARAVVETWAIRWQTHGVYLKVLEKCSAPPALQEVESMPIVMPLDQILQKRLSWATGGKSRSLQSFCRQDVEDADGALLRAAQDSPRQLIQLGNNLLEAWVQSGRAKLDPDHFKAAGLL